MSSERESQIIHPYFIEVGITSNPDGIIHTLKPVNQTREGMIEMEQKCQTCPSHIINGSEGPKIVTFDSSTKANCTGTGPNIPETKYTRTPDDAGNIATFGQLPETPCRLTESKTLYSSQKKNK